MAVNFASPFSVPLRTSILRISVKHWVLGHLRSRVIEVNLKWYSSIFGRKLVHGKKIAENHINNLEASKSDQRHKKAWQRKLLPQNSPNRKNPITWDFQPKFLFSWNIFKIWGNFQTRKNRYRYMRQHLTASTHAKYPQNISITAWDIEIWR